MNNVMCYMNYDMCYAYTVVCYVQNHKYDGVCYSNCITLLIKILKVQSLSSSEIGKSTDLTFYNNVNRKELFLLMHVLGVWLHKHILSTSVY